MTTEAKPFEGCGGQATLIIFRGKENLFACAGCREHYAGSGGVKPYETEDVLEPKKERRPGVYSGPLQLCGDRVARAAKPK